MGFKSRFMNSAWGWQEKFIQTHMAPCSTPDSLHVVGGQAAFDLCLVPEEIMKSPSLQTEFSRVCVGHLALEW